MPCTLRESTIRMKQRAAVLLLGVLFWVPIGAGQKADSLFGSWTVRNVVAASDITAMSGSAAARLVGHSLVLNRTSLRFERQTCYPTWEVSKENTATISEDYRLSAKALKLPDPAVHFDGDCMDIFVRDPGTIVFTWEGYFLEATRTAPAPHLSLRFRRIAKILRIHLPQTPSLSQRTGQRGLNPPTDSPDEPEKYLLLSLRGCQMNAFGSKKCLDSFPRLTLTGFHAYTRVLHVPGKVVSKLILCVKRDPALHHPLYCLELVHGRQIDQEILPNRVHSSNVSSMRQQKFSILPKSRFDRMKETGCTLVIHCIRIPPVV